MPFGRHSASLSRRFAWMAAVLAAGAVLAIAGGSWWWITEVQRGAARALVQKDTELRAAQVGDTLERLDERLSEIARSPLLATALTDSVGRAAYLLPYLGSIQAIDAIPVELLLVDFQGAEIARNGDISFSPAQREWMRQRLQQGQPGVQLIRQGRTDELLAVQVVRYPRTGTVEGALLAKLDMRQLLPDDGFRLQAAADAGAGLPADAARSRVALSPLFEPLALEVVRTAADPPLPGQRGTLVSLLVAVAGVAAAVLLLGQRLALRLTADLRALDEFARGVAENAFGSARAPVTGRDEVSSLARSVNLMLDRLNAQHARLLDESAAQLRLLGASIAQLNDVVMITDAQQRIVFVNDAFVRLSGWQRAEVMGRSPKLLQGPATDRKELDRVGASLRAWHGVRAELLNYAKDGHTFWIEMNIVPVAGPGGVVTHWVAVERDISERKSAEAIRQSLEQQVREAQKMEAIGTLAGGIAHDFNNILGAILGNVALAQQALGPAHPAGERIVQIQRAADRARHLVTQILAFSRRQPQALLNQPLGPLVQEAFAMLRATVPARVRLELHATDEPIHAVADATALEQVLMNLGTNAWHALQGSTGRIEFGLDVVALDDDAARQAGLERLPAGSYAHLWVADDGSGMDAATQARVFEPFFTTKPVGRGTGLGLSVVHGIVQSHGGAIRLDSAPGQGTRFHVYLPRVAPGSSAAATALPVPAATAPPRGQGQHVLYIDDDEVMVLMAEALVGSWGYRVTALGDARAAVAALRAQPQAFDVVVTDFNMPEMSGVEVLRAVAAIRPDLPVLLTSGYLPDEVRAEALAAGARALLRKENIQEELAEQIARALLRPSPPAG